MIYTDLFAAPEGHYGMIYADPAWKHVTRSEKGVTRRAPGHHYKTMSLEDIKALPVERIAAKNCHLMMWTTQPHLEQSFGVMKAWGFRYSSVFCFWLKLNQRAADEMFLTMKDFHMGTGFTTRKNVELLLLGRRGAPPRLCKRTPDFLITARRRHSQKPDEMFPRLEQYGHGPRIELNARQSRPGWDQWGDEVDTSPALAAPRRKIKPATPADVAALPPAVPEFLKRMAKS